MHSKRCGGSTSPVATMSAPHSPRCSFMPPTSANSSIRHSIFSGAIPIGKRNNRLADALAARAEQAALKPRDAEQPEHLHARVTFSAQERLSHRDFDTLTSDEWRTLRHQIRSHRMPLATEPTRRLKTASHGTHADLRASARSAVRSGGDG